MQVEEMYDYFKRKSTVNGVTKGERMLSQQKKLLDRLLVDAPNSYKIKINDKHTQAIIQDVYFNDELIKEKHMICRYGTDVSVGDYVYWNEEPYIVLHKEDESVRSKQGVKIKACDNMLTWMLNGEIVAVPTITDDKTSPFSDGLNKTGGKFVRASDQISAIVQENNLTNQIELNQRFIFDHNKMKVFRLTRIKSMPSLGILELVLKRDGYSPHVDNLTLNLADYYKTDYNIIKPYICGVDSIAKDDEFEVFTLKNFEGDIEWKVTGNNMCIKPVTDNSVEAYIRNKDIFDVYVLSAYSNGELIAKKNVSSTYM